MTHIRNHRWLALLACVAMLALVFGCHGRPGGDIISFLFGCWNGNVIELFTSVMVLAFILVQVNLSLGDETDSSAVGTAQVGDPAELRANVDGEGPIHYVGTVVQTGSNLTIELLPEGVDGAQVGVDTMTLVLEGDTVKQELTGTMTWFKDGEEFSGPANFERYPE